MVRQFEVNVEEEVVWSSTLDERFDVKVIRIPSSEGVPEGYEGMLIVSDRTANDSVIFEQLVGLSYGATFGPDVSDVNAWCETVLDFIDAKY